MLTEKREKEEKKKRSDPVSNSHLLCGAVLLDVRNEDALSELSVLPLDYHNAEPLGTLCGGATGAQTKKPEQQRAHFSCTFKTGQAFKNNISHHCVQQLAF
ncbi:hypothetical protein CDAR_519131 [Caerostris darwini]|uniref:Uncharacterized protein n=1 Tax=Caerostris darwini TaxID=1538125 RepID=A0AAV4PXP3_9ARAC|nr:hypothetical protein CDAR_519131 [Caerostris darwini]